MIGRESSAGRPEDCPGIRSSADEPEEIEKLLRPYGASRVPQLGVAVHLVADDITQPQPPRQALVEGLVLESLLGRVHRPQRLEQGQSDGRMNVAVGALPRSHMLPKASGGLQAGQGSCSP